MQVSRTYLLTACIPQMECVAALAAGAAQHGFSDHAVFHTRQAAACLSKSALMLDGDDLEEEAPLGHAQALLL